MNDHEHGGRRHEHHHGHGHDEHRHAHDHEHDHEHRPREEKHSPAKQHKHQAPASVDVLVVTVSDTRTAADDSGGEAIKSMLAEEGHRVVGHERVPDDAARVREVVQGAQARVVILTGGTGIAPRDVTIEALEPLWEKRLPGFGELFRALSAREIGAAAWLSRAAAGTISGARLVFALPGSPAAVELALEHLILPELGHAAGLLAPPDPPAPTAPPAPPEGEPKG